MSILVLANRREKAGQLHEHGSSDHSSGNVHTILGPRLWRCSSHIHTALSHRLNERVRCTGKISINIGEGNVPNNGRSMGT